MSFVGTVKARRITGGDGAFSGVEGAVATFILAKQAFFSLLHDVVMQSGKEIMSVLKV